MQNYFHPWHHVEAGSNIPEEVNGLVEISRGSRTKYELDKESGLLRLDRVLYSSVYFPANYGFIPRSFGEDHDPLDVLILSQQPIEPLCVVPARVIGVMGMIDSGENDDKLIAVATGDPSVNYYRDINDLHRHVKEEVRSFFEDYKKLENKEVRVEEFQGKDVAQKVLKEALDRYDREVKPHLHEH